MYQVNRNISPYIHWIFDICLEYQIEANKADWLTPTAYEDINFINVINLCHETQQLRSYSFMPLKWPLEDVVYRYIFFDEYGLNLHFTKIYPCHKYIQFQFYMDLINSVLIM